MHSSRLSEHLFYSPCLAITGHACQAYYGQLMKSQRIMTNCLSGCVAQNGGMSRDICTEKQKKKSMNSLHHSEILEYCSGVAKSQDQLWLRGSPHNVVIAGYFCRLIQKLSVGLIFLHLQSNHRQNKREEPVQKERKQRVLFRIRENVHSVFSVSLLPNLYHQSQRLLTALSSCNGVLFFMVAFGVPRSPLPLPPPPPPPPPHTQLRALKTLRQLNHKAYFCHWE